MNKKIHQKLLYLFTIWLTLIVFISCADDPNAVGNSLIPEEDKLNGNSIELFPDSSGNSFYSFEKDISFFGSSNRILLGKYENITSEVLISFTISLPDSIEEHLENETGTLQTSWIEMQPNYWIGDSNAFGFSVQEINTSWTSIYLDQDTLDNIRASLGPDILESMTYEVGDTAIKLTIASEVVENWVGLVIDESLPPNYGIFLTPSEATNAIAGFQALTSYPIDIYPLLYLVFESNEGVLDTVLSSPKLDMHIITGERLPEPPNEVLLQGALGVRGKLKFDLDEIPTNILVNSAILDLYYNEDNSFEGTVETDTVALRFFYDADTDSVNYSFGKYPLIKDNGKYSGEVRQFVQRWLLDEPNEGMEVDLSDGKRSASAISFYGSSYPTKTLRPRLTIYYTTK